MSASFCYSSDARSCRVCVVDGGGLETLVRGDYQNCQDVATALTHLDRLVATLRRGDRPDVLDVNAAALTLARLKGEA
jgi:hypothetical protein